MYKKQAAILRIVADNPGLSQSAVGRKLVEADPGASKYSVAAIYALAEAVPPSPKRPNGRPPYLRREGEPNGPTRCYITDAGRTALLEHEAREAKPPAKGFMYKGSPEPTRFVPSGFKAVGPVIEVGPDGRQQYAAPHEPSKRTDLSLLQIRTALQQARAAHEKIVDSRGGPQVLVDLRADATIRALDLLVDRLYGSK
jgi:hypothetical protein